MCCRHNRGNKNTLVDSARPTGFVPSPLASVARKTALCSLVQTPFNTCTRYSKQTHPVSPLNDKVTCLLGRSLNPVFQQNTLVEAKASKRKQAIASNKPPARLQRQGQRQTHHPSESTAERERGREYHPDYIYIYNLGFHATPKIAVAALAPVHAPPSLQVATTRALQCRQRRPSTATTNTTTATAATAAIAAARLFHRNFNGLRRHTATAVRLAATAAQ
jgi:hypothetical protein